MIRCIWLAIINIISFVLVIVLYIIIPIVIPIFPFGFLVIFIVIPIIILIVVFIITFRLVLICWREDPPIRIQQLEPIRQAEKTGTGGVSKDG